MQVVVRLVGRDVDGNPTTTHFELKSAEGKQPAQAEAVYIELDEVIGRTMPGLSYSIQPDGVLVLSMRAGEISPAVAARLKRLAQEALDQI